MRESEFIVRFTAAHGGPAERRYGDPAQVVAFLKFIGVCTLLDADKVSVEVPEGASRIDAPKRIRQARQRHA